MPTASPKPPADAPPRCALIHTDDDIPSGSATAGALYVADAELGRQLLTADVVAVARGFLDGGADCVHVLDSHDGAIDPKPLADMGVPLLTPSTATWTWPFFGPMDNAYTMAALVGFHARAGSAGMRPHTINDSIRRLRIDHETVGEVSHIVLGLRGFGIPVVLVSGDAHATGEAQTVVPDVAAVTVRWREADGTTGFLSAEAAAVRLHDAAKAKAQAPMPTPTPSGPVFVELEAYSARVMRDRMPELGPRFAASMESRREALEGDRFAAQLDRDVFAGARLSEGGRVQWTAPNPLTAYVSIAVAASHFRGPDNWDDVTRGYQAHARGEQDAAVQAYERALRTNPYDVATHCRLGAALKARGDLERARSEFAHGFDRLHEVGGDQMQAWCAIGLAQTALASGADSLARQAALQVLAVDAGPQRSARALEVLHATAAGPRMTRRGGLEGHFPIEALSDAFTRRRGVAIAAATVTASLHRVGQLVVSKGRQRASETELVAAHRRDCIMPHRRRFNAQRCDAIEDRRCDADGCAYEAYGTCTGLFLDRGLFVTAAHCLGADAEASGLQVIRHRYRDATWRSTSHGVDSFDVLKTTWRDDWVIPVPSDRDFIDVAVLRVDEQDTLGRIDAAPVPKRGAPVFMLGFPRSDRRDRTALLAAGYDPIFNESAVSFGRVVDRNRRRGPLCSTTGRQDDWQIRTVCPTGTGADNDGQSAALGLITHGPFLSNIDTASGYSGGPVFDASGRWIGINVTVYGADPHRGYSPAMRTVHLHSQAVLDALRRASVL